MRSLYSGACGIGDMRSRLLYIRDTRSVFIQTSVACGRIHQGHERLSDDPQGQMIFKCLAAHSQYSPGSILCPLRR